MSRPTRDAVLSSFGMRRLVLSFTAALSLFASACAPDTPISAEGLCRGQLQMVGHSDVIEMSGTIQRHLFGDETRVGAMYSADDDARLEMRQHGIFASGDWQPMQETLRIRSAANAYLDLHPTTVRVELRARGKVQDVHLEFFGAKLQPCQSPVSPSASAPSQEALAAINLDDVVLGRDSWNAVPRNGCGEEHTPAILTLHHTATPNVDDLTDRERIALIQNQHINVREWCDIGYHFLIGRDGSIYRGRVSETRTGAHTKDLNTNNVGIALLGNYVTTEVPQVMLGSASVMVQRLTSGYGIPADREHLVGHREWGISTDCPGNQLLARFDEILYGAQDYDGDGVLPPEDCDNEDGDNWDSCLSCIDIDNDGYFVDCDRYQSRKGPDCDDRAPEIYPGQVEILDDGIDQDCDGIDNVVCYEDRDGDGFGSTTVVESTVCNTAGTSTRPTDCNDNAADVNPGAEEFCDDIDHDCDGQKNDAAGCKDDNDDEGGCAGAGAALPLMLLLGFGRRRARGRK